MLKMQIGVYLASFFLDCLCNWYHRSVQLFATGNFNTDAQTRQKGTLLGWVLHPGWCLYRSNYDGFAGKCMEGFQAVKSMPPMCAVVTSWWIT